MRVCSIGKKRMDDEKVVGLVNDYHQQQQEYCITLL